MPQHLLNKTQQLERMLRRDFSSSRWTPGAKLPSEDTLMKHFGVGRPSIREALNTLAADGILVRRHGSGTYLQRRPVNRIEVYLRLENIATVSGYWYRDMLHEIQLLGGEQGIRIEPVTGFGETVDEVMTSLERTLSRPPDSDLTGSISLLMSENLDAGLRRVRALPLSTLATWRDDPPASVILDYDALADEFRRIMLSRGYADYTLFFTDDSPDKNGRRNYEGKRQIMDRITGGDRSRQFGINSDFATEAEYQAHLQERFLAWYRGSDRTRAAVFFDDGTFGNCCRVMARHGIRIPQDLAALTHANVGRDFDFPVVPCRVGFDPRATARAMWRTVFEEVAVPVIIPPVVMPGDSLPPNHPS